MKDVNYDRFFSAKRIHKVNEWVRCKFCKRLNLWLGVSFNCNRCGKLNTWESKK